MVGGEDRPGGFKIAIAEGPFCRGSSSFWAGRTLRAGCGGHGMGCLTAGDKAPLVGVRSRASRQKRLGPACWPRRSC
jgi:hypothetical protein